MVACGPSLITFFTVESHNFWPNRRVVVISQEEFCIVWADVLLPVLSERPICGYAHESAAAVEPTALTAMALSAGGYLEEARAAARFLASLQNGNGSVGVRPCLAKPAWTTSLAMLTWMAVDGGIEFQTQLAAATAWTLETKGLAVWDDVESGHDTKLIGWSWAEDTHSWVEPTILHVLSLKAMGLSGHERVREAVRLLIDRQLPDGGCNYGNTSVMGQYLRPHLQPSGMLLLALADEQDDSGRFARTIDYVTASVAEPTSTASWCWALLGLHAVGRVPDNVDAQLQTLCARTLAHPNGALRLLLALVSHAALGDRSPLCSLPGQGANA